MNCYFPSCYEAIDHANKNKTFGCFFTKDPMTNMNMHVHDCCEILLALSDATCFLIGEECFEVKRGDLFLINQFEQHKISAMGKTEFLRYIMQVSPIFLHENSDENTELGSCFYSQNRCRKISLQEDEITELQTAFEKLGEKREFGDGIFKKITAIDLLLSINKIAKSRRANIRNNLPEALQKAIFYINERYSDDLSLEDVAQNAYVSVTQLCHLFKRYCSTTVGKYLTSKRIAEAKKSLLSGKNVAETASDCGFNDYANFIRIFTKTVGTPPGKYKQQNEK